MKQRAKSYVIFGVSKFGSSVALELSAAGMNVLAVDRDPEKVASIADHVTMAVVADLNDAKEIEPLGLSEFDGAIVATTGDLAASVMGVILAKEAGIPLVLAKASDEMQAKVFERLGADRVIIPEKDAAARIAHTLVLDGFIDMINLSDEIRLAEIPLRAPWAGKTLRQLDLRGNYHLNVAAVRVGDDLSVNWGPDAPLPEDCSLVVIADRREFDNMQF